MTGGNWIAPDLALEDGQFCGPLRALPDDAISWGHAIEIHIAHRLRAALDLPAEPDPESALFDRARANVIRAIQAQLAGGALRACGRKAGRDNSAFEWIPRHDWMREASIDASPAPWRALFSREGNAFVLNTADPAWCQVWITAAPRTRRTATEQLAEVIARQAEMAAFERPGQDDTPEPQYHLPSTCEEVGMWVLVTTEWRWREYEFPAGWVGAVAHDTATAMFAEGVAVRWPPPDDGAVQDPIFRGMPANWEGGDLRREVLSLVLGAPEVMAFDMFQSTAYALGRSEVAGPLAVARWRPSDIPSQPPTRAPRAGGSSGQSFLGHRSGWLPKPITPLPLSNLPTGRRLLSETEAARIAALAWWRKREIDRLMCELMERLRMGEWKATGIRDDTAEAQRVTVPPRCWDHPRYELTWQHDGAALRPETGAPGNLPHYAQVAIGPMPESQMGTAAAESRCRRWLAEVARAYPEKPPKRKPDMAAEAMERFGVNGRGFTRAWDASVPESWTARGRPISRPVQS